MTIKTISEDLLINIFSYLHIDELNSVSVSREWDTASYRTYKIALQQIYGNSILSLDRYTLKKHLFKILQTQEEFLERAERFISGVSIGQKAILVCHATSPFIKAHNRHPPRPMIGDSLHYNDERIVIAITSSLWKKTFSNIVFEFENNVPLSHVLTCDVRQDLYLHRSEWTHFKPNTFYEELPASSRKTHGHSLILRAQFESFVGISSPFHYDHTLQIEKALRVITHRKVTEMENQIIYYNNIISVIILIISIAIPFFCEKLVPDETSDYNPGIPHPFFLNEPEP